MVVIRRHNQTVQRTKPSRSSKSRTTRRAKTRRPVKPVVQWRPKAYFGSDASSGNDSIMRSAIRGEADVNPLLPKEAATNQVVGDDRSIRGGGLDAPKNSSLSEVSTASVAPENATRGPFNASTNTTGEVAALDVEGNSTTPETVAVSVGKDNVTTYVPASSVSRRSSATRQRKLASTEIARGALNTVFVNESVTLAQNMSDQYYDD